MRGYFGIGAQGISKPMNIGNIFRSAHAFGASFVFTIDAHYSLRRSKSDTALSSRHLPFYEWSAMGDMVLPKDCALVGVELVDDAVDLPSFRHPARAAYLLGPELGSLAPETLALCDHIIRIPTQFCINVATAAAIVLYDRTISLGGFPVRPEHVGGPKAQAHLPSYENWRKPSGPLRGGYR